VKADGIPIQIEGTRIRIVGVEQVLQALKSFAISIRHTWLVKILVKILDRIDNSISILEI